ncbi:MAG: hypothetical protein ACK5P7_13115, partial [Bdellovibrio sp.]
MIVRDATANFFIVYGSLFSRKVVESNLALKYRLKKPVSPEKFIEAGKDLVSFLSSGTSQAEVNRLHPKIQNVLQAISGWSVERVGRTGDLVCKSPFGPVLVEIKSQSSDCLDEAVGSGVPFAEDQLLRDLAQRQIKWGILTNGWSWRLYHVEQDCRMIEFCVKDMLLNPQQPEELSLFYDLLSSETMLNETLETSVIHRGISSNKLAKNLGGALSSLLEAKWQKDVAVRFLLRLCAARFLEDCGIIDCLNPEYQKCRLDRLANYPADTDKLIKFFGSCWADIDAMFMDNLSRATKPWDRFFDPTEARHLKEQSSRIRLHKIIADCFFQADGKPLDCSDLDIEFFGNFYQIVENPQSKNAAGRYFTSFKLATELSHYLSARFQNREVLREKEYILDPACGSAQLLRLLIPFAMDFVSYSSSAPTKLQHWRRFAKHLAGFDIDENCIWIARISLWLATAARREKFVSPFLKKIDVIEAVIGSSRNSYSEKLGFAEDEKVVAIISNPPWEELRMQFPTYFKEKTGLSRPKQSDRRAWNHYQKVREKLQPEFDKLVAAQTERNLSIRQTFGIEDIPNTSEVFFRICRGLLLGTSEADRTRNNLPYSIIMPDQFFVGARMQLRED